jgi:hypothetical protein
MSKSPVNRASSLTLHPVDRNNIKMLMLHHIKCPANLMGDVMIYTFLVLPSDVVICDPPAQNRSEVALLISKLLKKVVFTHHYLTFICGKFCVPSYFTEFIGIS